MFSGVQCLRSHTYMCVTTNVELLVALWGYTCLIIVEMITLVSDHSYMRGMDVMLCVLSMCILLEVLHVCNLLAVCIWLFGSQRYMLQRSDMWLICVDVMLCVLSMCILLEVLHV